MKKRHDMLIASRIEESIKVKRRILEDARVHSLIAKLAERCITALRKGGKVIVFGNGGSAADSQHIACELQGRFKKNRRALAAIALTTNASSLTALGNDYGFDFIFSRQVEALGKKGDCAIGISTSGNSPNVVNGIRAAKKLRLFTACLTGAHGGRLARISGIAVKVPSQDTPLIQEAHIMIGHILCQMIENGL
jgi:D-sedoheptulose 7-phosphate isomerase